MNALGVKLINGKEPLLRQIVFEIRYNHGYNYLDRCGKILNRISKEHGEWVIGAQITPQNANLYSMRNGCRFTFSFTTCNLSLDRINSDAIISTNDIKDFANQSHDMTTVVIDELGLTEFARIGLRAWYYFPCETKREADIWLKDLGVVAVAPDLVSTYGGDVESQSLAVVIAGQDHRVRIGFDTFEKSDQIAAGPETVNFKASKLAKGQKDFLRKQLKERRKSEINTKFAALIDFDSFHEDPFSIDQHDFIIKSFGLFMDKFHGTLSSIKKNSIKKG
jgi:hypothetical protein